MNKYTEFYMFLRNRIYIFLRKILRFIKRLFQRKIGKRQIIKSLKELGIKQGDVILLHSSLSRIGNVKGGAETVIDAFLDVLGPEGTLIMPALFWKTSIEETINELGTFNPKTTPVTIGIIPETFRKREGVLRSIHPTHSVIAYGAKAKYITENHENCSTNFGVGTPWFKVKEVGGKIMGLGISMGPVTFYHVLEDVVENYPLDVYLDKKYKVEVITNNGVRREMEINVHNPKISKTRIDKKEGWWIREFFTKYVKHKGLLKTGKVGKARSWIIRAEDFFNAQKELLSHGITIYTTEEEGRKKNAENLLK